MSSRRCSCPRCGVPMTYFPWNQNPNCPTCIEKDRVEKEASERALENSVNSHLKSSLTFLRLQFDNESTSGVLGGDVVIVVQGLTDQMLHAHKFILACKSPVLCKMFDTNMLEKETGILRIDDTTLPVMRAVVKFCYDAQIDFTDKVPPEAVLEVAHKYELDFLRKLCGEELSTTINRANLPKRLKLARKYEAKRLEEAASQFFKCNFDDVISDVLGDFC